MKSKHLIAIAFVSLLIGLPLGLFINALAQSSSPKRANVEAQGQVFRPATGSPVHILTET